MTGDYTTGDDSDDSDEDCGEDGDEENSDIF